MAVGCRGKGYLLSGVDGAGDISSRKSIFRPQSDTRSGQVRERKGRPRTGDCCVAGSGSMHRRGLGPLLFLFLGNVNLRRGEFW